MNEAETTSDNCRCKGYGVTVSYLEGNAHPAQCFGCDVFESKYHDDTTAWDVYHYYKSMTSDHVPVTHRE